MIVTKEESIERAKRWNVALIEGRVVRYNDGLTLTAFACRETAEIFAREVDGEIVKSFELR